MSRVLPMIVLGIGTAWFLGTVPRAEAQFQNNQQFNPQAFQQPVGNGGPPTAPQSGVGQLNNPAAVGGTGRPAGTMQFPGTAGTGQPGAAPNPNFRIAAQPTTSSTIPAVDANTALGAVGSEMQDGETPEPEEAGSSWWSMTPEFVKKLAGGGWLMLPLAVCSLIVLTLSLERLVSLRRSRVIPRPFVRRFTECVEDGQLSYDEATELCKEFDCPVSEVFRAALRRWGRPMLEIEQAVMDAGDRVSDGLRRFLRVFHAISNVAPLIGLLGTVIGMINSFEVISDTQSLGRPDLLASGISTALMTTAGGLMVAIPAYLAYMYFSSKSDRYLGEIEKLCQRVVDCISAEGLENAGSGKPKRKRAA